MERVYRSLLSASFRARQERLREALRPLQGTQNFAARAAEHLSEHMPETDIERDALWWTCVLQRDMDSFHDTFAGRYGEEDTVYLAGWPVEEDDEEAPPPRTAIILCPDYHHLATRMRGPSRKEEAEWHETRYRDIHAYLCAANLLPRALKDDSAPDFEAAIQAAIGRRCVVDNTLNTCGIQRLCSALRGLKDNAVVFLAVCGHGAAASATSGQAGMVMLAGGDRLCDTSLAHALREFRGTLILAYCMCHAGEAEPAAAGGIAPEGGPLHALATAQCCVVRIHACARSEKLFPSQARTFTRLLERMARESPPYEGLQEWVDEAWPTCRPLEELPSEWRPAPTVTCTPAGTRGRFLEPAISPSRA